MEAVIVRSNNGFSLVEAAVILGVLGVVIGGIWVAAGAINEDRVVNRLATATAEINSNMRVLFKGLPVPSGNITSEMIAAGVVPPDFKLGSVANGNCWNSGSGPGAISPDGLSAFCIHGHPSGFFWLEVANLTPSKCMKYLSRIQSMDFWTVELGDQYGPGAPYNPWPMPLDILNHECQSSGFSFRIRFTL